MHGTFTLKLLLVLVWLGAMGWLIRFEAFPHWFDDTAQGYRGLMRDLPAVRDTWMRVLADGKHVGYFNSGLDLDESDGREQLVLLNQFMLRVETFGGKDSLRFNSEVRLGGDQRMQSFQATFFSPMFEANASGVRQDGNLYEITLQMGQLAIQRRIRIPDQTVMAGVMGDFGLQPLREGQTLRLRTLDPFSMGGDGTEVVVTGEGSEEIVLGEGDPQVAVRMRIEQGEWVLRMWVSDTGQVLRQETPFGLVLEAATVQEAIRVPDEHAVNLTQLMQHPGFFNLPQP